MLKRTIILMTDQNNYCAIKAFIQFAVIYEQRNELGGKMVVFAQQSNWWLPNDRTKETRVTSYLKQLIKNKNRTF